MTSPTLREARVGERLAPSLVGRRRPRRLEATAILVPGAASTEAYRRSLADRATDLEAWDGRVVVTEPDGGTSHRVLVVDRYGQVYATSDAADTAELPDADALEEWFRFLATACPECGVIDDPIGRGWTP